MNFTSNQILKMLPHRAPFLLVDKVIDCIPGKSAVGIKNVTISEPCFQGHFPLEPVFPGVLTIEVIAQTAAVMYGAKYITEDETLSSDAIAEHIGYLVSSKIKFLKPIYPGDRIHAFVRLNRTVKSLMSIEAEVRIEDTVVAKGSIGVSERN